MYNIKDNYMCCGCCGVEGSFLFLLRGAKTFSAVGYCSPRSGVEWWEPSRGRVCKNFVVSSRRGSVWVGCVLFPAVGAGRERLCAVLFSFITIF